VLSPFWHSVLTPALLYFMTLLVPVVMLNALIAIMGDTCAARMRMSPFRKSMNSQFQTGLEMLPRLTCL
jgi:hypothetical protein